MRRPFAYLAVSTIFLLVTALAPLGVLLTRAQEAALPAVGDPVTFPVGDGEGTATVTVTQVVDPFGAFGSGAAPEGERFVYVAIAVANEGDAPLELDPATIFVVDTDGFVHRPAEVFDSGAESEPQTIAPGDRVDGGVVVAVPEDAVLAAVYHDPAEDRLILLASLGVEESTPEATEPPAAETPDLEETPDEVETPAAEQTALPVGDVDCAAFDAYYANIADRFARLQEIAAEFENLLSDPLGAGEVVQAAADAAAALAEEQESAEVPPGLEQLNDQAVEAFRTYGDAFDTMARGLASLDMAVIQQAGPILSEADDLATALIDQLNVIAESCGLEILIED